MKSVPSFVEQLDDTDYLNLFLTNLGYVVVNYLVPNCVLTVKHPFRQTMQDTEKLAGYCDAVRIELESRDLAQYVNSILTAFVVKRPPDHEAALSLLHRLRGIVFKKKIAKVQLLTELPSARERCRTRGRSRQICYFLS